MPFKHGNVLSWASIYDGETLAQANRLASLPFIYGHVALMADAHVGKGATIGSVVATQGAIIPSAVGVDLGCGVSAVRTSLVASDLPDDLEPLLNEMDAAIPAGVGQGHEFTEVGSKWYAKHVSPTVEEMKWAKTAIEQFGTLGSGNHFIEVCLDDTEPEPRVWLMLHSGSRGIGYKLAARHIDTAKGLMKRYFVTLPDGDLDLAYFVQGTPEFDAYIKDLMWAQDYAAANRERMIKIALLLLANHVKPFTTDEVINNHHNYARQEHHQGKNLWVTRKGAISARAGELGVIPGSMGTGSFIVRGLGHPASFTSAPHGAGRAMSRTKAKQLFTTADLEQAMVGKVWLKGKAKALVDEIPGAYKDLGVVIDDSKDLVEVVHRLTTILNMKGT